MLLKLYEKNNNPADLQQVINLLNDGGIIIYPTDTMYAIGCHGLKERAIKRICRLKDIDPKKNNLSIICYDLSKISEYAKVDNSTFKLMKRNLPGAFTFILNGTTRLPKIFRNRKEVGIRMPFLDDWKRKQRSKICVRLRKGKYDVPFLIDLTSLDILQTHCNALP